jgi:hypothetical protein
MDLPKVPEVTPNTSEAPKVVDLGNVSEETQGGSGDLEFPHGQG